MSTIRDVAKLSGVSTATVSNVLNSRMDRVRPETRDRVLAAIRQLRYRPTPVEKGRASALTRNVGVVVPNLTKHPLALHSYFRLTLDGILEVALLRGWSVTIFVEQMWDDLGTAIRRSYDGRCDGLLMIHPNVDGGTVRTLRERGVPLVLVGTSSTMSDVSSVDIDNESAGAIAAQHLLSLGHQRFAFIGQVQWSSAAERERGFRNALCKAGFGDGYRLYDEPRFPGGAEIAAEFANLGAKRPTGVFVWHDPSAIDLLSALSRRGLSVPRDLSIVGVNGQTMGQDGDPSLTSIPQPLHAIGKRAANLLLDRLADPTHPAEVVRFSVDLQIGASSGPSPDDIRLNDIDVHSRANGGSYHETQSIYAH